MWWKTWKQCYLDSQSLFHCHHSFTLRYTIITQYIVTWRRKWHPTPVLLPGKSHGRRSLVDDSPWGREELDTTERLYFCFSLSCIGEGNGNPLQRSCLENPRDGGAWWAAVYGVAQSWTRLKWLSSSGSTLLLLMLLNTCFEHLPLVCWKMFRWYEMAKKSRKEMQWRNPGNGRIIRKFGKMFVIGYPYWWLRSYRYAGSQ